MTLENIRNIVISTKWEIHPEQLNYFVISLIKTELWIFLINLIGLV